MKWELHMDDNGYCSRLGMVSPPYRVGKFIEPGGVKVKYGLWHERELIGYFPTFEECQEAAEKHQGVQQVMEGRT